jgi:peptide chain release factor 3
VGTKYVTTAFGSERETIEEAYPGDVIGLINTAGLQIGDTLHAGKSVAFPALPRFAPEVFATARPLDSSKFKQFRRGMQQLDEEGVVQVLRDPDMGDADPILAAVGQLQFEVLAHRLQHEFNAPVEILNADYQAIRITKNQFHVFAKLVAFEYCVAATMFWLRCSKASTACNDLKQTNLH